MPLQTVRNDIATMKVDVIVNVADESLLGGEGVDGAIHRATGPELLVECRTLGSCKPGQAKITKRHHLPEKFVIHTEGLIWRGGSHGERDLQPPPISSEVYSYPKGQTVKATVDKFRS